MARFVGLVHFDPSFWQHVHHTHVVEFSVIFLRFWFRVCFLLGDKQEAKFGGVISAKKHSLQTWDLARFGLVSYLYDFIFYYFSNIWFLLGLVGKVLEMRPCRSPGE